MMDNRERELFKIMLNRYRTGNATREEISFLESWFDLADATEDFITAENEAAYEGLKATLKSKIDVEIAHIDAQQPGAKRVYIRHWAAAAAIAAIIGLGSLLLVRQHKQPSRQPLTAYTAGAPTLRLADGTVIALDSVAGGRIASQQGVIITKEKDGSLLYTSTQAQNNNANQENILSMPAGMTFKIILPDGSTVWLNAASKLKYPASFGNADRTVQLEGEAYFDIAAVANKPFIVQSGHQSVLVLGTSFNVNAYTENDASKTTLLQGSVKVNNNNGSTVIQPGQQAICDHHTNHSIVTINADTEKETAWMKNMFSFKNDNLQVVMREVARWYNVQIKYRGPVSDERFFGEISRNSKLEDVLKILEVNGITFEINGNVITIANKQ